MLGSNIIGETTLWPDAYRSGIDPATTNQASGTSFGTPIPYRCIKLVTTTPDGIPSRTCYRNDDLPIVGSNWIDAVVVSEQSPNGVGCVATGVSGGRTQRGLHVPKWFWRDPLQPFVFAGHAWVDEKGKGGYFDFVPLVDGRRLPSSDLYPQA